MCTVTYRNSNGRIIITSNRDEQTLRPRAIEPQKYRISNKEIIFPKDQKAGGTWFAVTENGTVAVLLNGAAEKHQPKESYLKSRGLIVLELISSESVIKAWKGIGLQDIEPFTLVILEKQKLYQLRWDAMAKSTVELDAGQNHIWSSSTLYPKEIREGRSQWFFAFLAANPQAAAKEMLHFHRYTEEANKENGLVINRNNSLKTLSITQTIIEQDKIEIHYSDLIAERIFSNTFTFV